MKFLTVLLFASLSANAMPELYCVSTSGYGAITKISIFTDSKGTLRTSVEVTSQEGYFANTEVKTNFENLKYNSETKTISNSLNTFNLQLAPETISPIEALDYGVSYVDDEGHESKIIGHGVGFKMFRLAQLVNLKLNAKKDSWEEAINKSFKAGVNQYLCGDAKDMIKSSSDENK